MLRRELIRRALFGTYCKRRHKGTAAGAVGERVMPLSGSIAALAEILRQSRGEQLETGEQDLASSLGGGYWSKR